jgi:hypothetical protein
VQVLSTAHPAAPMGCVVGLDLGTSANCAPQFPSRDLSQRALAFAGVKRGAGSRCLFFRAFISSIAQTRRALGALLSSRALGAFPLFISFHCLLPKPSLPHLSSDFGEPNELGAH